MDKKKFLNLLNNVDEFDLLKLYDKYELAKKKRITVFTNEFYTPDVWGTIENARLEDVSIDSYGVFPDSDRRVIAFNREFNNFPVKLIEIKCNTKFTKLSHKDYLGAIMATGIKREKLGEIILDDDCAYVAIHEDMVNFIILNLDKVKNLNCKCSVIDESIKLPMVSYEEKIIISTSTRLDCIIAAICNISRSKSTELINQGKVLVNYVVTTNKSYEVMENIKITIKGLGKFKVGEFSGATKNGRLKVKIFKYT